MMDNESRNDQCISLLNKIDYSNLSDEQLQKLTNNFLLNNYTDEVKRYLKCRFNNELRKRKVDDFFQEIPKLKSQDFCSWNVDLSVKRNERSIALTNDKILIDLKDPIKQEIEQNEQDNDLMNEYFKNLINLGSFSLITSSIYSLNKRSIILLIGGWASHLPYSKDQGKQSKFKIDFFCLFCLK